MAETPAPAVETLLERQRQAPYPPLDAMSIEGMREQFAAWNRPDGTPEVGSTTDLSLPGEGGSLPVRVYAPASEGPHPLVAYFHGGGWVLGDLDTHDQVCRALTNAADCITVAVDYRRAPEHPFPAAVEDAVTAVEWLSAYGDHLGGDTDRIAVAGDSSGGCLAAATTLWARDHADVDIAAQVLAYPVTNYEAALDSYDERAEYGVGSDPTWFKDHYLASPVDGYNPLAFPLQAGDLGDVPPAFVATAEFDPLRDDGIAYADRLADAGVPTTHRHFDGMIHGFLHYDHLEQQSAAIDAASAFLTDRFGE